MRNRTRWEGEKGLKEPLRLPKAQAQGGLEEVTRCKPFRSNCDSSITNVADPERDIKIGGSRSATA